jgi:hypothetical protein
VFKSLHYASRLIKGGVDVDRAEAAVREAIAMGQQEGQFVLDEVTLIWRSHVWNGQIWVGTIHIKW